MAPCGNKRPCFPLSLEFRLLAFGFFADLPSHPSSLPGLAGFEGIVIQRRLLPGCCPVLHVLTTSVQEMNALLEGLCDVLTHELCVSENILSASDPMEYPSFEYSALSRITLKPNPNPGHHIF
ncbi:hypothetical protein RUM43_004497 [Polyplax serrata]|uniref:Uncharacterized protein n=1 Tax=Polyplax serrata TaxID=468196 RepID=A0AAN8SC51_POLSC